MKDYINGAIIETLPSPDQAVGAQVRFNLLTPFDPIHRTDFVYILEYDGEYMEVTRLYERRFNTLDWLLASRK